MAILLSLGRVVKFSFQDVIRNIWLSLVTILIMILALFSINLLLAVKAISSAAVDTIKDKIDVSLYLQPDVDAAQAAALKAQIAALDNVRSVDYVSQAEALTRFQRLNNKDPKIGQALSELSSNPLAPSLVVHPSDTDNFQVLIDQLNKIDNPIIESRDFENYKLMLDKINGITNKVSEAGFLISTIFVVVTLLVIYNTSRVTIYTHKNEIAIMRLVGASNSFIKAPFIISSLVYTLVSMLVVMAIFYLFLNLLQPYLETFFAGYTFNILAYFADNALVIFGSQFGLAALVTTLASWLAVSKYSQV